MKTSYGSCGHFAKGVWRKRGLKVAFLQKPFIDEILKIYQQIEKKRSLRIDPPGAGCLS